MEKNYTIAVFDFDGTITTKDSFLDILIFAFGYKKFLAGIFYLLPDLLAYFSNKISAHIAKEKAFSYFFKGFTELEFNKLRDNYFFSRLNRIIKGEALEKIKWHKEQGHKLVIISASIDNWIRSWALENGFEKVIATVPEVKNGFLTGKFKTKNCNKEEKAKRFLMEYPNREDYCLYVYGDSRKDNWLFDIADEKFYRKF